MCTVCAWQILINCGYMKEERKDVEDEGGGLNCIVLIVKLVKMAKIYIIKFL